MKKKLRETALEIRKTLNCCDLSKKIMTNLMSLPEYKKSKNVLCYYPLKYEVDTMDCINDYSKNIYLPRVNNNFLEICPCGNLRKGSFGIKEPQTQEITDYSIIDIVIIPACAADKNGFRLGYGKGYYDRFLNKLPKNCIKIILVYSKLLFDTIYPDIHDVKSDIVVTDNAVIKIRTDSH